MAIKKEIEQFQKAKKAIGEYFGVTLYDGFDDGRDYYWQYDGDLNFWDEKPEEDEDAKYSHTVLKDFIKDEFTLLYVYDDCGSKYYMLLDNSKRID